MKAKLIYTDKAGNKLYVRFITTRNAWQWSAKNAEGKVVTSAGVRLLMQRALRERATEWKAAGKHEMVEKLRSLVKKLPKVAVKRPKNSKKMIIERF
jgi:hypothetical protein